MADEDDPENGNHFKFLVKAECGVEVPLNSMKLCEEYLKTVISKIGMRELDNPKIYNVPLEIKKMGLVPYQDEGGTTGTGFGTKVHPRICGDITLSTSHVSIHTWPLQGRAVVDVYSCRNFNPIIVLDVLLEIFKAYDVQYTDLSHSLKWKT